MWLSRERFRDEAGGSAGPWIFAIARNVLLASVRAGALDEARPRRVGAGGSAGYEEGAVPEPAWLDGLDEAFDDLPSRSARRCGYGWSRRPAYDEVAAALNTTPAAAGSASTAGLTRCAAN